MSLIEWQSAYEIGIEIIDEQHQQLVKLINQLEKSIFGKEAEAEAERVLVELVNYIRYHFAEEEKLMGMSQYAQIDQHCEMHQKFVHHVSSFLRNLQEGKPITSGNLLSFLKSWLIEHIMREDTKLRSLSIPTELSK